MIFSFNGDTGCIKQSRSSFRVKEANCLYAQEGFTQLDFNFVARGETCWNGVNYMLRTGVNMEYALFSITFLFGTENGNFTFHSSGRLQFSMRTP